MNLDISLEECFTGAEQRWGSGRNGTFLYEANLYDPRLIYNQGSKVENKNAYWFYNVYTWFKVLFSYPPPPKSIFTPSFKTTLPTIIFSSLFCLWLSFFITFSLPGPFYSSSFLFSQLILVCMCGNETLYYIHMRKIASNLFLSIAVKVYVIYTFWLKKILYIFAQILKKYMLKDGLI